MTCKDVRERLEEYVDGEVGLGARLSVGVHLLRCGGCREVVREGVGVDAGVGGVAAGDALEGGGRSGEGSGPRGDCGGRGTKKSSEEASRVGGQRGGGLRVSGPVCPDAADAGAGGTATGGGGD